MYLCTSQVQANRQKDSTTSQEVLFHQVFNSEVTLGWNEFAMCFLPSFSVFCSVWVLVWKELILPPVQTPTQLLTDGRISLLTCTGTDHTPIKLTLSNLKHLRTLKHHKVVQDHHRTSTIWFWGQLFETIPAVPDFPDFHQLRP